MMEEEMDEHLGYEKSEWSYIKQKYKLNVTHVLCSQQSLTFCFLLFPNHPQKQDIIVMEISTQS